MTLYEIFQQYLKSIQVTFECAFLSSYDILSILLKQYYKQFVRQNRAQNVTYDVINDIDHRFAGTRL